MRIPAEERKEQLIAATVELMRREGLEAVTVRAVAKEANVPLGTVHYCFSGKEELMEAAAEAWLKKVSSYSGDVPVHLGLRKAVEQVAEAYWCTLEEEPASLLAGIELTLWATRNAPVSPLAGKIYPAHEVELRKIFSSAASNSGEESRISHSVLVRSFLMVFRWRGRPVPDRPEGYRSRGHVLHAGRRTSGEGRCLT